MSGPAPKLRLQVDAEPAMAVPEAKPVSTFADVASKLLGFAFSERGLFAIGTSILLWKLIKAEHRASQAEGELFGVLRERARERG